jgi:uncharacterized membrane protein YqaE (UPF0057 family)
MRILLAIILPPVAMLLCGKVFQAVLCLLLMITVIGWIPAAIWAVFVVQNHNADVRNKKLIKAIEKTK